jgi:hypothetical protein
MYFYVLYALPFVVAAIVLIVAKYQAWRDARDSEVVEAPIMTPEDPMVQEVRSAPLRKHYTSYSPTIS